MTRVLLFLALGIYSQCSSQISDQFIELELISIQQQSNYDEVPLELSGIVEYGDRVYVVSDNYEDNYVYGIDFSSTREESVFCCYGFCLQ